MSELKDKDEQYKKYLKLDSEKVTQEKTLRRFSGFLRTFFILFLIFFVATFIRDNYESVKMYVSSIFGQTKQADEDEADFDIRC